MSEELELYLHIPFCVRKCNYCDFLSFTVPDSVHESYTAQLINELKYMSHRAEGYRISSVFIGGGTPSVMSEYLISDIMGAVYRYYAVTPDAEITIECNPSSVLRHKFAVYKKSGINRLSIGLQSADNAELKMLGRPHTFEEFLKTYQSARMEGFPNINIDLINCFPMQSLKTWKRTLRSVCMLKPEHISVYNLIIEEGTPFYDMREKGLLMMPSEDEQAGIDAYTRQCLARYGYNRYEFSNYARPGFECRHNTGYWRGISYIGFGLGASSYFEGSRFKNITDIAGYMSIDFESGEDAGSLLRSETVNLTREDMMEEYIYLGMRLTEGISMTGFKTAFGVNIEDVFGNALEKYVSLGFIVKKGDRLCLTNRGIDISNVILSDFLLH